MFLVKLPIQTYKVKKMYLLNRPWVLRSLVKEEEFSLLAKDPKEY